MVTVLAKTAQTSTRGRKREGEGGRGREEGGGGKGEGTESGQKHHRQSRDVQCRSLLSEERRRPPSPALTAPHARAAAHLGVTILSPQPKHDDGSPLQAQPLSTTQLPRAPSGRKLHRVTSRTIRATPLRRWGVCGVGGACMPHLELHPSPLSPLPSSQPSTAAATTPSPHTASGTQWPAAVHAKPSSSVQTAEQPSPVRALPVKAGATPGNQT